MATLLILPTIILIISISSSFFLSPSSATDGKLSFIVDYIHRDSPLSPYHNSSQTPYERVRSSINRDRYRLSSGSDDLSGIIISPLSSDSVEYIMSISIGTPPFKILAVADTGSDLIWTQCVPCRNCYKQDAPFFDPTASSTFKELSCGADTPCPSADFKCDPDNKCSYSYHYTDGSFTNGVGLVDTITFDSLSGEKVAVENINIGCTHESKGTFKPVEAGIIGLARGPMSLSSQLGDRIDNKFSYCLVPNNVEKSSTFSFGSSTSPDTADVVKVPILQSQETLFYKLNLESITVADTAVPMVNSGSAGGNIIIDSGTTFTFLPTTVVDGLISAISNVVTLPTVVDPQGVFDLCFNVETGSNELPDLKLDFGNDAVITLPPLNMFTKISDSVTCFAVIPTKDDSRDNILGNVAQQNFRIEYDVGNKILSFAPTDCSSS